MKWITVLRTARGRASPVGREEAAERRRRVNSTQALLEKILEEIGDPLEWRLRGEEERVLSQSL
jgi:hypothetical protein